MRKVFLKEFNFVCCEIIEETENANLLTFDLQSRKIAQKSELLVHCLVGFIHWRVKESSITEIYVKIYRKRMFVYNFKK